jgi:HAD superfamily hydrolase (TIGR01549 family)
MEFIQNYHLKNGGVSRVNKFKYFHKKILKRSISNKEIEYFSSKFDNYVNKKIINLKTTTRFLEFIKICKIKKINLYISSAASRKNIEIFLKHKNILGSFLEIYDQSSHKIDHVKAIKKKYRANSLNTVYIGDSISDLIAAKKNNIDIFLRKHKHNTDLINKNKGEFKVFNNFSEIKLL